MFFTFLFSQKTIVFFFVFSKSAVSVKNRLETSYHRQKQIRDQPKPVVFVRSRFETSCSRRISNLANLQSSESAIQRIQLDGNLANLQFGEAKAAAQRIQLNCNLANLQLGEAAVQRICKSAIRHQIQNQNSKSESRSDSKSENKS